MTRPYSKEIEKLYLEIFPNATEAEKKALEKGDHSISQAVLLLSRKKFEPEDIIINTRKNLVAEAERIIKAKILAKALEAHWGLEDLTELYGQFCS